MGLDVRTIFGPPGTGKTRNLIELASAEIEIPNSDVTCLSYTKVAAAEIASRVDGDKKIFPSTIHSLAFNQLQMSRASVIDFAKLEQFSDASGFRFKKPDDEDEQEGDQYRAALSYAKAMMINPNEAYDMMGRPGTINGFENFVITYTQWKNTYGYMDFDDMLERAQYEDFPPRKIVMLDEAQDCSPLQWAVFNRIIEGSKRVYVAGDDDQAIFEWNGADPHGMVAFSEKHGAKYRVLEQSHRIPSAVHEYVHDNILANIKRRVEKEFKARTAVGEVNRYGELMDTDLLKVIKPGEDTLILVRDQYRMRDVQNQLHYDGIPYSTTSGPSSPYESMLASAIRGHRSRTPDPAQRQAMIKLARNKEDSIEKMLDMKWYSAFRCPQYLLEFYETADLESPINVRLSTIHTAKGTEATNVLVDLTVTNRVELSIMSNPDPELRVWYVALTRTKDRLNIFGENPLI